MSKKIKYYKVLLSNGETLFKQAKNYKWSLPSGKRPGKWMEPRGSGPIALCSRGLHVAIEQSLRYWLSESLYSSKITGHTTRQMLRQVAIFEVEVDDAYGSSGNEWHASNVITPISERKIAFGRARLVRKIEGRERSDLLYRLKKKYNCLIRL